MHARELDLPAGADDVRRVRARARGARLRRPRDRHRVRPGGPARRRRTRIRRRRGQRQPLTSIERPTMPAGRVTDAKDRSQVADANLGATATRTTSSGRADGHDRGAQAPTPRRGDHDQDRLRQPRPPDHRETGGYRTGGRGQTTTYDLRSRRPSDQDRRRVHLRHDHLRLARPRPDRSSKARPRDVHRRGTRTITQHLRRSRRA